MKSQTKTVTKIKKPVEQFKFTDRKLKSLKHRLRTYKVRDKECPKLYLQVTKKDKKFISIYKIRSVRSPTSTTHGSYGDISIATARKLHQKCIELAVQGFHPKESLLTSKTPNIIDLCKRYVQDNRTLSPRTIQLYEGIINNHLSKPIFKVSFDKLDENKFMDWHNSYEDKGTQVNINCLKLLSATWNAQPPNVKKDSENPQSIIKRKKANYKQLTKVDVYLKLDDDEGNPEIERFLRYLWDITVGYSEPINEEEDYFVEPTQDQVYMDAILLMLLTGLRVSAVIELEWTQVDFQKDLLIALEKGRHGEKKLRVVPLTKYTYRLLRYRQKNNKYRSKYVFPSQLRKVRTVKGSANKLNTKGKQHIKNPVHIWEKLKRRAEHFGDGELIDKTDRHSLRRTISRISKILGYDMDSQRAILDQSATSVLVKNYTGSPITTEKLRHVYEEIHNFIDNRLAVASGRVLPVFIGEQDMEIEDLTSPLMSLWDINDEPLQADRWLTSYDKSGFSEKKSMFSEYD